MVMYPSISRRSCKAVRLLMSICGRPVDMNMRAPSFFACVRASMVEAGISCVWKLTRVPSMSKNKALFMMVCITWAQKYGKCGDI